MTQTSRSPGLRPPRAFEHLHQILAVDSVALGLADLVHHNGALLTSRLAAAALLLRFEVQQLAGLQVTGVSRFRDWSIALG